MAYQLAPPSHSNTDNETFAYDPHHHDNYGLSTDIIPPETSSPWPASNLTRSSILHTQLVPTQRPLLRSSVKQSHTSRRVSSILNQQKKSSLKMMIIQVFEDSLYFGYSGGDSIMVVMSLPISPRLLSSFPPAPQLLLHHRLQPPRFLRYLRPQDRKTHTLPSPSRCRRSHVDGSPSLTRRGSQDLRR